MRTTVEITGAFGILGTADGAASFEARRAIDGEFVELDRSHHTSAVATAGHSAAARASPTASPTQTISDRRRSCRTATTSA
jgi:hypothetical protein